MSPLQITLIILLCTIIAFVSGKIPFSIISVGIILALIFTGVMTPAEAMSGFINTNVVMFVAMFVIGAGLTKTSLLDRAQSVVVRYKDNLPVLIFFSSLVAGFLGCVTSATATAAIMIPLLVGISAEIGVSRSKLLYPTMAVSNIATAMTFLGQGASNMTWSEIMVKAGAEHPFQIWDFTIARIPVLIIAILYMVFIGYKIAFVIIGLTIAGMLFEKMIGIDMYLTASVGAVLLVLTGVLSEQEALSSIHQPTVFLFAGVLALSDAIRLTGAGDVVADWMIRLLGNTTNPYIIMTVFYVIPFLLTQVMSNLATYTIFIPLVASACVKIGLDPRAAVMGVLMASCVSIMTPMAAPCQIMIMEPGGYKLKDYLKCGTPLAIIIAIVSIFMLPMMFPF